MKMLPICCDIPFLGYNKHAFTSGILLTEEKCLPYVYSNLYINILSTPAIDDLWCDFLEEQSFISNREYFDEFRMVSFLNAKNFSFFSNYDFINKTVIEMIDKGFYLYGSIDDYYVPYRWSYKREHYLHDYLLCGYDLDKCTYYCLGYNIKSIFEINEINFNDFYDAVRNADNVFMNFEKISSSFNFTFDKDKFLFFLKDYINGTNSLNTFKGAIFGIDVMLKFVEICKEADKLFCPEMQNHDFIFIRNLYEHKKFMLDRIKYMYINGFHKNIHIMEEYQLVVSKMKKIYAYCLKCTVIQKRWNLESYYKLACEINDLEKKCFNNLNNELKK